MINLDTLGIAYKARLLVYGEALIEAIRSKKAKIVIIATDASANSQKKIINKCLFYEVDYLIVATKQQLSLKISKANVAAVAILDKNLAKKIILSGGKNNGEKTN